MQCFCSCLTAAESSLLGNGVRTQAVQHPDDYDCRTPFVDMWRWRKVPGGHPASHEKATPKRLFKKGDDPPDNGMRNIEHVPVQK
jgi:hypothetical protein